MTWAALQTLVLPDDWQAAAIRALGAGRDVVVDAPTGAGKTYIFEKVVERGGLKGRAIYTVPTRALANDKFAEWRARGWRVGIQTGDTTLDAHAPLVVATLEAAQGRLTGGAERAALVVIDEYQWIGDANRGNHYEGVIAAMNPAVRLLLLSGCVGNPGDVGAWLERLGRRVEVVRHATRPVPIEEVDADGLSRFVPPGVSGFWAKRMAGALREDLGPILVFAPHRQDAERLARQAARELPNAQPLALSEAQGRLAGPALGRLLEARVAFHHSGLTYAQRAGLIEPLAKAGQLRVVVATLGLSAGINFSLRSVMITGRRYAVDGLDREIQAHELLQMIGRAGRRGKDETGYLLVSSHSPRLAEARPMRLRRAAPLPWSFLLRQAGEGAPAWGAADRLARSLFTTEPVRMGHERTRARKPEELPCGLGTDTGRARLVRKERNPFPGCAACALRGECLEMDTAPSLLWQWERIGLLDRGLGLTPRGRMVACFLGPEGLAVAAAVEDAEYDPAEAVMDFANLFAGSRFAGDEARWGGRLAVACNKVYRRFSIDGYLHFGVPPQYGAGGEDVVRELSGGRRRRGQLTGEHSGVGDIDRLVTEWRSLLRQIVEAPDLGIPRWTAMREAAARHLEAALERCFLLDLPPLTTDQRNAVSHRLRWRVGLG